jgi:tetratricopeptide (TPR) repeat protein
MSILDGMIQSEVDPKALIGILGPIAEQLFEKIGAGSPYGELIREGHSPADILGLTQSHRDAFVIHGYRAMQAGNIEKARDFFMLLQFIEPLDNRAAYGLGVTYQAEGKVDIAAKLFVQYLALDATCAKGYLRLGECFLTAKELDKAASCFRIAQAEAERGNGDDNTRRRAEKLLAICEAKLATAPAANG